MNAAIIGSKLQQLRGKRTQEEVAKGIGVSTSAIQMYESGKRVPRDHIKIAIAKYYGVSVEQLFFEGVYTKREQVGERTA